MKNELQLIPRILGYRSFRAFGRPKMMPINLTVSVTNKCNSSCKTCFIWRLYHDKPELKKKEFERWEFEETFDSIGKSVFWVTITGGEPYLRADLPEICSALCEYCEPRIINIPTNALLPKAIEDKTRRILEKSDCPILIVNLSMDGVGPKHDEIRGVPGNFKRLLDTYQRFRKLKAEFPHLQVGIHSVVSKYSIGRLFEVYAYAKQLGVDSYITEVAEQRTELFTTNKDIVPDADAYAKFINELSDRLLNDCVRPRRFISRITRAFRLAYYQISAEELRKHKQIIPCYAGFASCQISAYGGVWPCCILGYDMSMGNLRESDYDFKRVWLSEKAETIREYIKNQNCACPLANANYTNILCNFKTLVNVLKNFALL